MAKQLINLGTVEFDGTGDPLRTGGQKINDNFDELYGIINNITQDSSDFVDIEYTTGTPKLPLGETEGDKIKWTVNKEAGETISSFGTGVKGSRKYLWISIEVGYVHFSITALGSNGIFQTGLASEVTYSRYNRTKATDYYFICDCLDENQWLLTEVGNLSTTSVISESLAQLEVEILAVSNEGKNIENILMADFVVLKDEDHLVPGRNYKVTDFLNYKGESEPILLLATADNNFSLLAKSTISSDYNIWIKPVLSYIHGGYFYGFIGDISIEFDDTKVLTLLTKYDEFLTRWINTFLLRGRDGDGNEIVLTDSNYNTHWTYDEETHKITLIGDYYIGDFDFTNILDQMGTHCLIDFANQIPPYWTESRRESGTLVTGTETEWDGDINERFDTSDVYSDISLIGNATLIVSPEYEPINIPNTTKKYVILNTGDFELTLGTGITLVSGRWDNISGHTNILELTYFAIDKVYAVIYSNVIKEDTNIRDTRVAAAVATTSEVSIASANAGEIPFVQEVLGVKSFNYSSVFKYSNGVLQFKDAYSNIGIGDNCFSAVDDGDYNLAFGIGALRYLTTGGNNSAFGHLALNAVTSGLANSALGYNSLSNTPSGGRNSAFGSEAGTFYGSGTDVLIAPNDSVFFGYRSRAKADSQTNEIVVGYEAIGNGSNSVTIGNDSITQTILKGNVGVGYTGSANIIDARLKVKGAGTTTGVTFQTLNSSDVALVTMLDNGKVGIGTTSPASKLMLQGANDENSGVGKDIVLARYWSGGAYRASSIFHSYNFVSGKDELVFGVAGASSNIIPNTIAAAKMVIEEGGKVGIGTTTPAKYLEVTGAAGDCLRLSHNKSTTYKADFTLDASGNLTIAPAGVLAVSANITSTGSVKVAADAATAASTNVGAIRYRTSGDNSYCEMCMQTGASSYAWITIIQNNW